MVLIEGPNRTVQGPANWRHAVISNWLNITECFNPSFPDARQPFIGSRQDAAVRPNRDRSHFVVRQAVRGRPGQDMVWTKPEQPVARFAEPEIPLLIFE